MYTGSICSTICITKTSRPVCTKLSSAVLFHRHYASSATKNFMRLTVLREVEQRRQLVPVGQTRVRLPQLVEERVGAGLQRADPRRRRVLQQTGDQLDGLRGRPRTEHLQQDVRKLGRVIATTTTRTRDSCHTTRRLVKQVKVGSGYSCHRRKKG